MKSHGDYLLDFLKVIKELDLFCPEICIEEDGDIEIGWHFKDIGTISVSVSKNGGLSWAGYIRDETFCGTSKTLEELKTRFVELNDEAWSKMREDMTSFGHDIQQD